jgi:periodic tryptophan protein 1
VVWNPAEPTVLLSGSFDKTAAVVDMRSPQHPALTWQVSADVECAAWDPHAPQYFVVSTEDGLVRCHDVRKGKSADGASTSEANGEGALFTLAAHDKPTCSISFNPAAPNVSAFLRLKLWKPRPERQKHLARGQRKPCGG